MSAPAQACEGEPSTELQAALGAPAHHLALLLMVAACPADGDAAAGGGAPSPPLEAVPGLPGDWLARTVDLITSSADRCVLCELRLNQLHDDISEQ